MKSRQLFLIIIILLLSCNRNNLFVFKELDSFTINIPDSGMMVFSNPNNTIIDTLCGFSDVSYYFDKLDSKELLLFHNGSNNSFYLYEIGHPDPIKKIPIPKIITLSNKYLDSRWFRFLSSDSILIIQYDFIYFIDTNGNLLKTISSETLFQNEYKFYPPRFPLLISDSKFYIGIIPKYILYNGWEDTFNFYDLPVYIRYNYQTDKFDFFGRIKLKHKNAFSCINDTWIYNDIRNNKIIYSFPYLNSLFCDENGIIHEKNCPSGIIGDSIYNRFSPTSQWQKKIDQYGIDTGLRSYAYRFVLWDNNKNLIYRVANAPTEDRKLPTWQKRKKWSIIISDSLFNFLDEVIMDENIYYFSYFISCNQGVIVKKESTNNKILNFAKLLFYEK